jgi:hypothetical protein
MDLLWIFLVILAGGGVIIALGQWRQQKNERKQARKRLEEFERKHPAR